MKLAAKGSNVRRLWGCCVVLLVAISGAVQAAPASMAAMRISAADKAPLVGAVRVGSRLVALGDHGTIVLSSDGRQWKQASHVPVSSMLTALWFVDGKNGWCVGHGGVILRTSDGGESWRLQHVVENLPVLLSVWFQNESHGIATGGYGVAYETHDGGTNWQRLTVARGKSADHHLNAIIPMMPNTLFIAGEGGTAFRSTDNGRTWTELQTGVSGSLWSGLALSDGRVLLFGMSGRIIVSGDKGESWQTVDGGTHNAFTTGVQLNDGRVILAGNGGVVAVSTDGVRSFRATILQGRQNIAAVAAMDGNAVLLFGQQGANSHDLSK